MTSSRQAYSSFVSVDEWSRVASYLTLLSEDARPRESSRRAAFDGLRSIVETGASWRWMPHALPPWSPAYGRPSTDCLASGRSPEPSAAILDGRTLRSTPESGERAGYDGTKRKEGPKVHRTVDTLGHLPAPHVTPAVRTTVPGSGIWPRPCRPSPGTASPWPMSPRATPARSRQRPRTHGIDLEVVKLPETKHGFVLSPRRRVVERSFAWATRFRRLVRDHERYPGMSADLNVVAFVCRMLKQAARLRGGS